MLNCADTGSVSSVINGIQWSVTDWKKNHAEMALTLTLSLSASQRVESMNAAIDWATNNGAVVVVAAGNEGRDASHISPCSSSTAICVGASTAADSGAYFSNYGKDVNIQAVGTNVVGAWPDKGTRLMHGTSMATPAVAGASAQLQGWVPRGLDVASMLLCGATRDVLNGLSTTLQTDCCMQARRWASSTFNCLLA